MTPEPGIYQDVPFAEYCAWDAVNNSRLGAMDKSPAHYNTERVTEDTKSTRLGSLVHAGAIEARTLALRYAVANDWHLDEANVSALGKRSESKATRYYKDKMAAFTEANEGREIVSRSEYDAMLAIVEAVEGHPDARAYLNQPGPVEASMVWDDPETGIRCKGRIDKVATIGGVLLDLKTTRDITDFPRAIARYGYHRQAAFYRRGWAILNGGELYDFWIVPVQNTAPYIAHAAPVSDEALEQGEREIDRLLAKVAECHEAGSWPGPELPEAWNLPEWALEPVTLSVGGVTVEV